MDFVENVSPVDRPALALFRKVKVTNTFVEWQEDALAARGYNAQIEGADASDPALTTPSRVFNHVQTFAKWGKVSDVQRAVLHAGFEDAYMYQEKKKVEENLNDIEHALHRGSAASGDTNIVRQLGGLLNILTTNFTNACGITLTETVFNDLVQLFTDNTTDVRPSAVFVNSWLTRTISQYSTNVTRNVNASERLQELVIERHTSDFGDIFKYFSRDQLKGVSRTATGNSLVILDPDFFETGWLQPLISEQLPRVGLSTRFQISAMLTLIYRTQKAGGGGINFIPYLP
jgi:hypothetical protein